MSDNYIGNDYFNDLVEDGITRCSTELVKSRTNLGFNKYYYKSKRDTPWKQFSKKRRRKHRKRGPLTKEHKDAISKANKGKTFTKEHKKAISKAKKGNTIFTKEHREKISKYHKGRTKTKEHREKIGKGNKGKIVTKETREKIAKARRGKRRSPETRAKIGKGRRGKKNKKPFSKEIREKMSKAAKARKRVKIKTGKNCKLAKSDCKYQYIQQIPKEPLADIKNEMKKHDLSCVGNKKEIVARFINHCVEFHEMEKPDEFVINLDRKLGYECCYIDDEDCYYKNNSQFLKGPIGDITEELRKHGCWVKGRKVDQQKRLLAHYKREHKSLFQ